tara:strand:- start:203 stop:970 length:768 start_codon:yes stop_codon:yes gene_type:complete
MGLAKQELIRYQEFEPVIEWLEENYEYDFEFEGEGWEDALAYYEESMEEEMRREAELDALEQYSYYIYLNFKDINDKFHMNLKELRLYFESIYVQHPSETLCKMVFAQSVTLLEVYLEELTKKLIAYNDYFLGNTLKNVSPFNDSTFKISVDFLEEDGVRKFVFKNLDNHLYHNIPKTQKILSGVIGHPLALDIKEICKITKNRHDVVHRDGKDKNGEIISLDFEYVKDSLDIIESFANQLMRSIEKISLENNLL